MMCFWCESSFHPNTNSGTCNGDTMCLYVLENVVLTNVARARWEGVLKEEDSLVFDAGLD